MTQPVQAMQASAAPENWKSSLKLPPKDPRYRTEVGGPPDPFPLLSWAGMLQLGSCQTCSG